MYTADAVFRKCIIVVPVMHFQNLEQSENSHNCDTCHMLMTCHLYVHTDRLQAETLHIIQKVTIQKTAALASETVS